MKSLSDRLQRNEGPSSHGEGKSNASSWQRSVKRKLPSAACELPPQARKVDNILGTSQNVRPFRQIAPVRKSLSDPLQVFGDCDEAEGQNRSLAGNNPSDVEERHNSRDDMENPSRENRRGLKLGLKDSTNVDPKIAIKQVYLQTQNEILVLKESLREEKEAHRLLQAELDEERNAASSAANEAMSMIARLQEEKAAVLMEARQFKRMAEEREIHNQEAILLLKEMLMNKEDEALALENELAACRQMFLTIEAGEPIRNNSPSYLDVDNYDNMILCDPKHPYFPNDLCMDSLNGKPANSEFNGRPFGRSLKGCVSDSIRGNLQNFFNLAGAKGEDVASCNGMYFKDEITEMMYDKVTDCSTGIDVQENATNIAKPSFHGIFNDDITEQGNPSSMGNGFSKYETQLMACCTDEQSRSLWNRIINLEQRLHEYGVDGGCLEFNLPGNVASSPETPAIVSCKLQGNNCCWDAKIHTTISSQEREEKKNAAAEGLKKHQYIAVSQSLEADTNVASSKNQQALFELQGDIGDHAVKSMDHAVKEPCEIVKNVLEDVHHVYEVDSQLNQGSAYNESLKFPEGEGGCKNGPSIGNSDLPSELMAPIMETMSVTPPDSAVVKSLSSSFAVPEEQRLNKRVQVLETEKHSMYKAILSLQAENKQLRKLQDATFQLQDLKQSQNLKRSLQTFEQPNKRVKSEQPSFTSVLRGFLSYFPSSANMENRSFTVPMQDSYPLSTQRHNVGLSNLLEKSPHVGLSNLLEKSPHLKTDILIVRGLKVKVPAAI